MKYSDKDTKVTHQRKDFKKMVLEKLYIYLQKKILIHILQKLIKMDQNTQKLNQAGSWTHKASRSKCKHKMISLQHWIEISQNTNSSKHKKFRLLQQKDHRVGGLNNLFSSGGCEVQGQAVG